MDQEVKSSGTHQPASLMDDVRALHLAIGTSIQAVMMPTLKIFAPHLLHNRQKIQSIKRRTEKYGPHVRHEVDVYEAVGDDAENAPILVYFYGGGLIHGDKTLLPEPMIYQNLGAFFAYRGITTIIPDYRRVNSKSGGEDAVFPSGGEDVSLSLTWLANSTFAKSGKRDVFIMGNSAGGLHISTFMLEPRFLAQRIELLRGKNSITWKGAIILAGLQHFKSANADRVEMLRNYFGDIESVERRTPYGLLEAAANAGISREQIAIPSILALVGQYDPQDEIISTMEDFIELEKKTWGSRSVFLELEGHNHISPIGALMSGDEKAEKWGEDMVKWIKTLCTSRF